MTHSPFSADYHSARNKFRKLAAERGAVLDELVLDVRGPDEQKLTIDIARLGAASPRQTLVHFTGLHGVEGFAGSAIQTQILRSPPAMSEQNSLILVHGVNPFGMAWLRRVNENNVDLNRNFLTDTEDYADAPEGYRKINHLLNPKTPPRYIDFFYLRLLWYISRLGFPELKDAIASGQYEYPSGLFFGGHNLQQGPSLLLDWLRSTLQAVERIFMVDVHTGLGRYGVDSLLVNYPPDSEKFAFLRNEFGQKITSLDPQKVAFRAQGSLLEAVEREFQGSQMWAVAQEFGTLHILRVLKALRDENRSFHYGPRTDLEHWAKRRIWNAFCANDETWQRAIIMRGHELVSDASKLILGSLSGV